MTVRPSEKSRVKFRNRKQSGFFAQQELGYYLARFTLVSDYFDFSKNTPFNFRIIKIISFNQSAYCDFSKNSESLIFRIIRIISFNQSAYFGFSKNSESLIFRIVRIISFYHCR